MSDFTYEKNDSNQKIEKLEWDNVWWEHTENETARRILYIGDSISCGIRRHITRLSNEEIMCDGFGSSKALDNPYLKPSLQLFMAQQNKCDEILFNNGLHGWHLSDGEYEACFDEMLSFLLDMGKPVYVVLTTNTLEKRAERVKIRNKIAEKVAQKYRLPVIDLHTISKNNAEHHVADGVHFTVAGYEILANYILENIR